MTYESRQKVIERFKEIMENMGCDVITLNSLSSATLKKILSKHGNKIETMIIVVRKW